MFFSINETFSIKAVVGSVSEAEVQGCKTLVLLLNVNDDFKKCFLRNVLYVPKLHYSYNLC